MSISYEEIKIAVLGLGYVGLPLACAFGEKFPTVGFDINKERVDKLQKKIDQNLEITAQELEKSAHLKFSYEPIDISSANVYIITVPTPIDLHNQPDLGPLLNATKTVANLLKTNDTVVYESTVYPGAIEEECVPILASISGLEFNNQFFVGYSPERINPGDAVRGLKDIVKVTSGSTPESAKFIDDLYSYIIKAGTHKASSIKVAEAAKVIENTQRDLNIALINELAIIFNKLNIDTQEVLAAAGTKWNFINFKPGLVGGHCIGVDPYYLTHKAQALGYHPEVILAGRRINDNMGEYVVKQTIKKMIRKKIHVLDSLVLILGFTFKENCKDYRNTKVIDMVDAFEDLGAKVEVYDPVADKENVYQEYKIKLLDKLKENRYDAIVLAVAHEQFKELDSAAMHRLGKDTHVIYDVKHMLPKSEVDGRL